MTDQPTHPFETHAHGGGGFTVFESGESVALPLLHLNKATLRGPGGQRIVLEYPETQVVVEGEGLDELFTHVLAGFVRTIRRGKHGRCVVGVIQVLDVTQ
jgi:hypothetical protein